MFGFLGTFTKFIDKSVISRLSVFMWLTRNRANLQTAFVSGMKEELGFYGNVRTVQLTFPTEKIPVTDQNLQELNYANVCISVFANTSPVLTLIRRDTRPATMLAL